MTKVSIIIPVYNVEKYLRQCLDSVINQTLREIEIICVDDGSTDSSPAILAEYAAKDPRVKVLTREKSNAGAARNAGMAIATGEYIGFVDSDDWCELTLFEKAYARAVSKGASLVSWRFDQYDDAAGKFSAGRVFPNEVLSLGDTFCPEQLGTYLFTPLAFGPWDRIVSRRLIEDHGLRFQEIIRTNDVYFCCMALVLARRQTLVDEVLYHYRIGFSGNLQSGNAETPELPILAWQAVVDGLMREKLSDSYRNQVVNAASNSLFYTLHSIDNASGWLVFFEAMRRLYGSRGAFEEVKSSEIVNNQTRQFVDCLRKSVAGIDYLVEQIVYFRKSLAETWWTLQSSKRNLTHTQTDLTHVRADLSAARDTLERSRRELRDHEVIAKALAHKVAEAESAIVHLRQDLANRDCEISRQRQKAEGYELKLVEAREMEEGLRELVVALENSWSYRIGNVILWPFRKVLARKGKTRHG